MPIPSARAYSHHTARRPAAAGFNAHQRTSASTAEPDGMGTRRHERCSASQRQPGPPQRADDLGSPPFLLAHHQCRPRSPRRSEWSCSRARSPSAGGGCAVLPGNQQRQLAVGRSLDSFCYRQRRARVRGSARRRGRPPGGPSSLVSRYPFHPRRSNDPVRLCRRPGSRTGVAMTPQSEETKRFVSRHVIGPSNDQFPWAIGNHDCPSAGAPVRRERWRAAAVCDSGRPPVCVACRRNRAMRGRGWR